MLCTGHDLSGPWQAWSDEDYDACACKMRPHETANDLPDLTDPCTLGGLLALVREAWGQTLCACRHPCGWLIGSPQHPDHLGDIFDSEAEALVAALEAAP